MIHDIKDRSLRRLTILQGQLRGLEKMVQEEQYCTDILTQSRAIQKSLASLDKFILENHLRTHITHMMSSESDETRSAAVDELVALYELHNIRGGHHEPADHCH